MPLENALANVPGLAGALGMQQFRQQQQAGQLDQASNVLRLEDAFRQQARREGFEKEMVALGPEPDQDQLAKLAARYGTPSDVLKSQQSSLDRKATLEVSRNNAQAAREARASALELQLADRRLNAQDRNAVMLHIAELRADASKTKAPPGYRQTTDGNLEAIPGGPADQKLQGAFNQDTSMFNSSTAGMDRLAGAANALKEHPGLKSITGMRGAFPNVPGSEAANAQALLDNLKSQVGFSVLQEMRNNSKTGGALGQVSDKENQLLQDNLAALSRAQSYEEYQNQLQNIVDYTGGAKDRIREAYNRKYNTASGALPSVAQPAEQPKPRKKPSEMTSAELAARRRELAGEKP